MLKNNLLSNYFGQAWVGLMAIVFIPLYVQYLGIEAFGLLGLLAILNAWMGLLDGGLTQTISREMARLAGGRHDASTVRNLFRSSEVIALGLATVVLVVVLLSAEWVASDWLQTKDLPVDVVVRALSIVGLIAALRIVEGTYRSCLVGLQKQVIFNVISASMATTRSVGSLAVLEWVSPTIDAFFFWHATVSVLSIALLACITYKVLPSSPLKSQFSLAALGAVKNFAGGITLITFLALLLMQADKMLLSKLLSLSDYGYYILASTTAAALMILIGPITQAFYPRLCQQHAANDQSGLANTYHTCAQMVSVLAGSAAFVIILNSEKLLRLWTGDPELAAVTAPILAVLVLGNLLNGLMHVPYLTQLAYGWTKLTVGVNTVAVVLLVPAIFVITPRYGALGAAWIWVVLNSGYILVAIHLMHRRVLPGEKWIWYFHDIAFPLGAGFLAAAGVSLLWKVESSYLADLFGLLFASVATLGASALAASRIRVEILSWLNLPKGPVSAKHGS